MSAHILTANQLVEGDVVYLTSALGWSGDITEAKVATNENELQELNQLGEKALKDCLVVDPHAVPVEMQGDIARPKHIKERIRAKGPSVHPHLGKQAENEKIADIFHSF